MATSLHSSVEGESMGLLKACRTAVYISHIWDGLQDGGGQGVW